MNSNSSIKIGFVFDLDGTLLDDIIIFTSMPLKLAEIYKIELTKERIEELKKKLIGGLSEQGGKSLIVKLILNMARELNIPWYRRLGFLKRVKEIYQSNLPKISLFENEVEMLKELKEKNNAKLGIFTTSSVAETYEKCKRFSGFLELFDDILGRDNVKKLKPNPEGLFKLSNKWKIPTSNIVMIGDMKNDILCGKNAHCITVGVLSGFSDHNQMVEWGADFILNHVGELSTIMDKIFKKIAQQTS
ncbi:MAG: HAD family hydrolase [Promethearchaeota archaeon]